MTLAIGIIGAALAAVLFVSREWRMQHRLLLALFYMRHDAPNGVEAVILARVAGASRWSLHVRLTRLRDHGLIARTPVGMLVRVGGTIRQRSRYRYHITDAGAQYAQDNLLAEVLG